MSPTVALEPKSCCDLSCKKMNYEFFSQTDPGLIRSNNEDVVCFDVSTRLCILADGMGGYNAGEVASAMAATFINAEMGRWLTQTGLNPLPKGVRRAMEICVENANHSIYNAGNSNPQYTGMGTTLVVGVFHNDCLTLGHIGDSRCYRLRGDALVQITKDHSLLQEQIDAGLITPEAALTSSNRNLVTRALGVEDGVALEIHEHRVESGDLYLMCSDGLSDMVRDEVISEIMQGFESLEQKAWRLTSAANTSGGRDNISVLLVLASQALEKRSFLSRMLGK
ncbi:Protein phosphatase PrpC [Polaromonas vacuolata]|uniref:Protein phosphatase PrpC n=2 Tax=Polaromonas vacuolata TaxID=37448 RepID=A0A6H2HE53_9BURK|nr:Protein phosphatase PrpC [Polaromonas vacuolata]